MSGVAALVMNIFLPSLPSMTEYFNTDYRLMQLSVALFLAANAVLQIILGPLSDRYGRRPIFLAGFGVSVLATIGCLLATTVEVFLFFRMLQATTVVGVVLGRAVIRDIHSQAEAASMIGYVTMWMAVVPMLSPALGGFLDQTFGWQASFFAILLGTFAVLVLLIFDAGESNTTRSSSFGQQFSEYPELLTSPRFWGYALAAAFCSGAFFAYLGGAPFIGTEIFGMAPAKLGIYFGAPAIGYVAGNFLSGRLSSSLGINTMVLVGSVIGAAGIAVSILFFLTGFGTAFSFFGFMVFVGIGNGMVLPNAISGTISVRPHLAGTASGLGGALMIGGGAALSALAGALLVPESGPYPLLYIQLIVSLLATVSILLVIGRERKLRRLA